MEVRRILKSDNAGALASFVDCSHKMSQTPVLSDVCCGTFVVFLVVLDWASHVQEHFSIQQVRSEATVFLRGTVDGRNPANHLAYIKPCK